MRQIIASHAKDPEERASERPLVCCFLAACLSRQVDFQSFEFFGRVGDGNFYR